MNATQGQPSSGSALLALGVQYQGDAQGLLLKGQNSQGLQGDGSPLNDFSSLLAKLTQSDLNGLEGKLEGSTLRPSSGFPLDALSLTNLAENNDLSLATLNDGENLPLATLTDGENLPLMMISEEESTNLLFEQMQQTQFTVKDLAGLAETEGENIGETLALSDVDSDATEILDPEVLAIDSSTILPMNKNDHIDNSVRTALNKRSALELPLSFAQGGLSSDGQANLTGTNQPATHLMSAANDAELNLSLDGIVVDDSLTLDKQINGAFSNANNPAANTLTSSATSGITAMSSLLGEAPSAEQASIDDGLPTQPKATMDERLRMQTQQSLEFGEDRRQWGNALGTRIMTLMASDVQQARIQLDPPELGSLEIRLQIHNDQATVQVHAQHGQVREVLEAQAHRLKEALAQQGIELSEFNVSSEQEQTAGQSGSQTEGEQNQRLDNSLDEFNLADDITNDSSSRTQASSMSLLDTFA